MVDHIPSGMKKHALRAAHIPLLVRIYREREERKRFIFFRGRENPSLSRIVLVGPLWRWCDFPWYIYRNDFTYLSLRV